MIYVPEFDSTSCAIIQDSNTIRVYESRPTTNSTINYTDYFFNSHYVSRSNSQTFNQYVNIPECIDNSKLTTDIFYRNDMVDIFIMFICLCGFFWFFISNLSKLLFRGRRRY